MKIPESLAHAYYANKVCRLIKSLRQASRQWVAKLVEYLLTQGYTQSKYD